MKQMADFKASLKSDSKFLNHFKHFHIVRDRLGVRGTSSPWYSLFKKIVDPLLVIILQVLTVFICNKHFNTEVSHFIIFSFLISALLFNETIVPPRVSYDLVGVSLKVCFIWFFATILIVCYLKFFHSWSLLFDSLIFVTLFFTPVWIIGIHSLVSNIVLHNKSSKHAVRRTVVVGANKSGQLLVSKIQTTPDMGLSFCGYFDDRSTDRFDESVQNSIIGNLDDVASYVLSNNVHIIYISLPMSANTRVLKLLDGLRDCTASIYFVPDLLVFDLIQARVDHVEGIPVFSICESPFVGVNRILKRLFDVVFSLLILLLIWPVLLGVAVAVKCTSAGPVFFKQNRYGENGESILVYKFRSMTVMENGDQVTQAKVADSRLTSIGGFLRRTSLDELPQFINVLQGSMSIVGPRPHANAHNEMYRKIISGYMLRHKVKPGITGWAQVNGLRGETDTVDKMERRVQFDLDYLRNWSLLLDVKIVFMTVFTFLRDKNAY